MPDANTAFWTDVTFAVGDCRLWRIGPLGFWIRRTPEEWQIAEAPSESEQPSVVGEEASPPDDAAWTRWASAPSLLRLRLRPVTPDHPVVVRPEQAFRVLQHGSARIYVSLPVWVRVELLTDGDPLEIIELPSVRLSNTWFGSLFEGELCYWLATSARRTMEGHVPPPHIATAPMTVRNTGADDLPLERICLHTAHLAIYADARGLWTSEVRVMDAGPDEPQKIVVSEGPPPEAERASRLSEPRQKQRGGVLTRAVGLLKFLPGAGPVGAE